MKKPLQILFVEDSEDDVLLICEELKKGGLFPEWQRVQTEKDMKAALWAREWDLVISDYAMPGFDAPAAIQVLRESGLPFPIIVISGTVGEDIAVETLKMGADDYLLKDKLTRLRPAVERALQTRESHERQRALEQMKILIMTNSLDMICIVDREGRYIEVSQAAKEILGYEPAELTGRHFMDFVAPEDYGRSLEVAKQILAGRPNKDFENHHIRKDGSRVVMMWSSCWSEADGVMIAVARDITRRKQQEEKLAEALAHEKMLLMKAQAGEKAKSEFLAMMSHEIRTPMTGILGFSNLLAEAPDLPPGCNDYVRTILASGEALLRILDDILDLSRLEAGGLALESAAFSPRDLAENIVSLLTPIAKDKRLDFRLLTTPGVPELVHGDVGRLRQILINLVGNAVKFTSTGSVSIGLAATKSGGVPGILFSVVDTGPGIESRQLERIFAPFTQADSKISRRYGGTGLGLSISKRLAEILGGSLSVESVPGHGSNFAVWVPFPAVELGASETATVPAHALPLPSDLKVLLVEDDNTNLKLIKLLIRKLGLEATTSTNGKEALEVYASMRPDCILMDLQMPEMDGIEAARRIRRLEDEREFAPVFLSALTANILPEDRDRCFESGFNAYINKPIRLTQLAEVLRDAAEFRRPQAACRS